MSYFTRTGEDQLTALTARSTFPMRSFITIKQFMLTSSSTVSFASGNSQQPETSIDINWRSTPTRTTRVTCVALKCPISIIYDVTLRLIWWSRHQDHQKPLQKSSTVPSAASTSTIHAVSFATSSRFIKKSKILSARSAQRSLATKATSTSTRQRSTRKRISVKHAKLRLRTWKIILRQFMLIMSLCANSVHAVISHCQV